MGVGIAVIIIVANLAMPHRLRLIGVALLLVPQLYVPELPVTLAFLWTLVTCLAGLTKRERSRADSALVVIMFLFISVTALSLLWALPSGFHDGVVTVFRGAVFLLWLREVIVLARNDSGLIDTIVLWTVPGVAIQSVFAIVFRVNPGLEERFLRSRLAVATIGPDITRFYSEPGNVIGPEKSGGFFVNGNLASLFGGIAALLLLIAARRSTHRWLYGFAALAFVGSIFTGSKGGLVIGIGCAIAILLVPHMLKASAVLIGLPIVLLMPLAYSLTTDFVGRIAPTFYADSDESFSGREELWSRAASLFQESPFLGLGFGGWVEQVGSVGGRSNRPPHNMIVAAWAYSGIIAAILIMVFIVVAVAFGLRVSAAQRTVRDRRTAVIALCAISWVFIQGMGENTTVYGEQRSMVLVALAFGYLYAIAQGQQQESLGSPATRTLPGRRATLIRPRTRPLTGL